MSNISAESTEWPSFPARQHDHLAQKVQELELILHTTLAEGSLLAKRQQQLANALASRKATLDRMYRLPPPTEPDCSEDELAETQRAGKGWGQSKGEDGLGRTVKQHQKFYSAIQSPAVSYSPERNYDQFTLQSYQKSRYGPQSTASSKSGMIRKQRDQLRVRETSYLSPRQRDFESIEEIWNGGSTRRGQ
jgi:hypothetical protein